MAMLPIVAAGIAILKCVAAAPGDTVTITPTKDNTLYEDPLAEKSNGAGQFMYVGNTSTNVVKRRGLVAFNVSGAVPAGSTITAVNLRMNMTKTIAISREVSVHRARQNWGEGTSNATVNPGQGTTPTTNDATWNFAFYPATPWSTPGGVFEAAASTTLMVGDVAQYTWPSTPQFVADVQDMLDNPATNFGWVLVGNEQLAQTAKQFNTRQATAATRPALIITYSPPPGPGDVNGDGIVDIDDYTEVILNWGDCTGARCPADLDDNGRVDIDDMTEVVLNWT